MDIDAKLKIVREILPELKASLEKCDLCPRNCGVDRTKGGIGFCGIGKDLLVYSCDLRHGEEPPLSGVAGSGTIFFSHCNMGCVYCQNHQFSQTGMGTGTLRGN
ncbi:MAG: hypothetical protein P9L88_06365 [Candidatus Tantalella remota]|nr:hypothetical protein [Candidatus Tantalella remota]